MTAREPMVGPFRAALSFLTILPAGQAAPSSASVYYFPVAGLLLGLAYLAVAALTPVIGVAVAAATILLLSFLLTRGLHMDGLADVADAFLAGHTKENILRIMKDTHIGVFGAVALFITLLFKYIGINAILTAEAFVALIYAAVLSRVALMLVVSFFDYVRMNGVGHTMQGSNKWIVAVSALVAIKAGVLYALLYPAYLLVSVGAVACIFVVLAFTTLLSRKIDGVTGDIYGAVVEISETLMLVTFGLVVGS